MSLQDHYSYLFGFANTIYTSGTFSLFHRLLGDETDPSSLSKSSQELDVNNILNIHQEKETLVSLILSPELFNEYKHAVTDFGFSVFDGLKRGLANDSNQRICSKNIGLVLADEHFYSLFPKVLDPLILCLNVPQKELKSDVYGGRVIKDDIDFGLVGSRYIVSCRVRVLRSLTGYPFTWACDELQRKNIEKVVKRVLLNLEESKTAHYIQLSELNQEAISRLTSEHCIYRAYHTTSAIENRTSVSPDASAAEDRSTGTCGKSQFPVIDPSSYKHASCLGGSTTATCASRVEVDHLGRFVSSSSLQEISSSCQSSSVQSHSCAPFKVDPFSQSTLPASTRNSSNPSSVKVDPSRQSVHSRKDNDSTWLTGRGLFCGSIGKPVLLVNETEHLKFVIQQKGNKIVGLFAQLYDFIDKVEDLLKENGNEFALHKTYGYMTSSPRETGSGLRMSVILRLPLLLQEPRFDFILQKLTLDKALESSTMGVIELSNHNRYGMSEFCMLELFVCSINYLIGLEEILKHGELIDASIMPLLTEPIIPQ